MIMVLLTTMMNPEAYSSAKHSILDVRQGSEYAPEIVFWYD